MRSVEDIIAAELFFNASSLVDALAGSLRPARAIVERTPHSLDILDLAERASELYLIESKHEDHLIVVIEHWAVSPWLGRKLIEVGEAVDNDFLGLSIWSRTTNDAMRDDPALAKAASRINRTSPKN
jgi:hypothetical protein